MDDRDSGTRQMLAGLLDASHLMPLELLPAEAGRYAAAVGCTEVRIYVGDLQRGVLRELTGDAVVAGAGNEMRVDGTVAGRAYQLGRILPAATGDESAAWWVPLLNGTERLGVLWAATTHTDERFLDDLRALASLVALVIVSKGETNDTLARLTRKGPLNVAAEMQWKLMPPRTYADGRVVVCGGMEPAYEVSGDAFDYAISGPLIHLSVFDAMGHDTAAGLTAGLAVGTGRNARRHGAGLVRIAERIEEELVRQYAHDRFATGILADLDTRTGQLSWVNRGHPAPLIIRSGRWSTGLECPPGPPMGTGLGLSAPLCHEQLEPGDRVVLYTDGITEARRAGEPEFGVERFIDFLLRQHADNLSVPETLRRLIHTLMEYHDQRLQDDATVLFCEWLGTEAAPHGLAASHTGLP